MRRISLLALLAFALVLTACASATPTAAPTAVPPTKQPEVQETDPTSEPIAVDMGNLAGTTWAWIAFTDPAQEIAIETPQNYTLSFGQDGSVVIVADCNHAMGTYKVDGSSLTIEVGPMTLAACPPESHSDDFVKYLGAAAVFFFDGGNLHIDLMADGGTLTFAPAEVVMADDGEGALAGALWAHPWQWVSFTSPVEEVQVDNPASYLLTFGEDGSLAIVADCNRAMASYTADGSSLQIQVGPTTLAACPPGSRSEDFIKYLGFAAIYFFQDGDLFIDLMADGGTLRFSARS